MDKYFVRVKGQQPIEITQQEFMSAEASMGFHSKTPGRPATAGFSGGPLVQYMSRSADYTLEPATMSDEQKKMLLDALKTDKQFAVDIATVVAGFLTVDGYANQGVVSANVKVDPRYLKPAQQQ
jgi:hypothetical protein